MQTSNYAIRYWTAAAVLLLLLSLVTGCLTSAKGSSDAGLAAANSRADQPSKQTADKLPAVAVAHASLPVSGMTCGSCEQAIQHGVGKLKGVSMVKASHSEGRVEVDYDPQQVGEQQIIAAIERLQYKVEEPLSADEDQVDNDADASSADEMAPDEQGCGGCSGERGCCGGDEGDEGQQA